MARPTLEHTFIQPFTLSGASSSANIPLSGPNSGMKPLITIAVSGTGGSTGIGFMGFSGLGACSKIGNINIGTSFVDFWAKLNVPLTTSTYLYVEGPVGMYGGVEIGYWDAISADALLVDSAGSPGVTAGSPPPGYDSWSPGTGDLTEDDTAYGMILGTPATADWTLSGGSMMETIYPSHGTTPPTYTNSQTVLVGAVTQAGAPKVCCGFVREVPDGGPLPWAFDFSATTTFEIFILRIRGAATVAVASQMVTILG